MKKSKPKIKHKYAKEWTRLKLRMMFAPQYTAHIKLKKSNYNSETLSMIRKFICGETGFNALSENITCLNEEKKIALQHIANEYKVQSEQKKNIKVYFAAGVKSNRDSQININIYLIEDKKEK